jgi:glycosyltransferase involved in cell wall biosynthesis
MRLLLVADTYPPARISGALQMQDLAHALAALGHRPLVLVPALDGPPGLSEQEGVQVLLVRAPTTKDVPYWQRTLAELALPWVLLRGLRRSGLRNEAWQGVVCYSPSIFLGPVIRAIKRRPGCQAYLIVRDLFPDWAVDAGVLRKHSLPWRFFKAIERGLYRQADVIGVQTPSNMPLVAKDAPADAQIEVLHNWLAPPSRDGQRSSPTLGALEGRINFIYAGNMGVAQDMGAFVELAQRMQDRDDVGFVFVGRGSEAARLKQLAQSLPNLLVLDEVDPVVLPSLLAQCHVGIVALHPAHHTHNIPGKLLTYLHAGLPVLARANANNDLIGLVEREGVGLAVAGGDSDLLYTHALHLADNADGRAAMGQAGIALATRIFSPKSAASAIVARLAQHRPTRTR